MSGSFPRTLRCWSPQLRSCARSFQALVLLLLLLDDDDDDEECDDDDDDDKA